MKTTFVKIFALLFIVFSANTTFGQGKAKFGHVNSQELLKLMPERDKAMKELEEFAQSLEEQLESMNVEYNQKLQNYLEARDTLPKLVREDREQELQSFQTRIQTFQQKAQQQIRQEEARLIQPILGRAEKAIQEVGEEQELIYVFDTSAGSILYEGKGSFDITDLVKKKLGIEGTGDGDSDGGQ